MPENPKLDIEAPSLGEADPEGLAGAARDAAAQLAALVRALRAERSRLSVELQTTRTEQASREAELARSLAQARATEEAIRAELVRVRVEAAEAIADNERATAFLIDQHERDRDRMQTEIDGLRWESQRLLRLLTSHAHEVAQLTREIARVTQSLEDVHVRSVLLEGEIFEATNELGARSERSSLRTTDSLRPPPPPRSISDIVELGPDTPRPESIPFPHTIRDPNFVPPQRTTSVRRPPIAVGSAAAAIDADDHPTVLPAPPSNDEGPSTRRG